MASPYRYRHRSTHRLPAPPEAVWTELERFELWTRWSRPLRSLDMEGERLATGTTLQGHVDPVGPFSVRVAITVTGTDRPHALTASITGDLEGEGDLVLQADGGGSVATIAWEVVVRSAPLRIAALTTRPLQRWLQRHVARRTAAGFREHLRRS